MEIIAHTREAIPESRVTEMASDCGVTLHEVLPQEMLYGYIPHRIVAYGEPEALHAFTQALTYSELGIGQINVWDG